MNGENNKDQLTLQDINTFKECAKFINQFGKNGDFSQIKDIDFLDTFNNQVKK